MHHSSFIIVQLDSRCLRMRKRPLSSPNDLQLRLAMRIRASDDSVRSHPVVRMCHPLLRSQQRQHRSEAVNTNALPGRQVHHLPLQREVIPISRPAEDALARRADDLDAEVV